MIEINLLPKEYRRRARTFHFDKKTMYAAAGVGALVLVLVAVTFYQRYQIGAIDDKMAIANAEKRRLQKDIQVIDELTVLKEDILNRMESIENLDRFRGVWVQLMQDLNQRVPDFMWLTRFSENRALPQDKKQRKVPGQKQVQEDTTTVVKEQKLFDKPVPTEIEGYAFTLSSIASFLVGLTKSEFFDNIDLEYAKEEQVTEVNAYKFKVDCDLIFELPGDGTPVEDVGEIKIAER
jgi:Tfp pilus assembly protein PilN